MKEKVSESLGTARTLWTKASRKARILFLSAVAGILLICLVVALVLNNKNYVLLYNGLSPQESANVLAVLGEMGVEPRVSTTGAISVPEQDANRARMQLAIQGVSGSSFGYDVYQNGVDLTSTQSDKDQWQINQLQNRLQDTIMILDEVQLAVVTISVPKANIYALQGETAPPTASVTIQKRPGQQLTAQQIQGILNLVRHAVSGLTDDNISITDESGDLKAQLDIGQGSSVSKLALTEEVNRSVRTRILSMLQPAFGSENVQVAVNSVLDIDAKATQSVEYIPFDEENPTNNPLDSYERDREKLGGEAFGAGAQGVPGANDNVDVPQYAAGDDDVADADSYATRDVYDYLVSSVRSEITKEGLEITDMTVAVLINTNTLSDGMRDQVIDIVARASGVPTDKISVQNIQFLGIPEYTADGAGQNEAPFSLTQIILLAGLIFSGVLILIIIIATVASKSRKKKQLAAEAAGVLEPGGEDISPDLSEEGTGDSFEPIVLGETQEQKLKAQIKDLADNDPEIVAQLIKTWLVQS